VLLHNSSPSVTAFAVDKSVNSFSIPGFAQGGLKTHLCKLLSKLCTKVLGFSEEPIMEDAIKNLDISKEIMERRWLVIADLKYKRGFGVDSVHPSKQFTPAKPNIQSPDRTRKMHSNEPMSPMGSSELCTNLPVSVFLNTTLGANKLPSAHVPESREELEELLVSEDAQMCIQTTIHHVAAPVLSLFLFRHAVRSSENNKEYLAYGIQPDINCRSLHTTNRLLSDQGLQEIKKFALNPVLFDADQGNSTKGVQGYMHTLYQLGGNKRDPSLLNHNITAIVFRPKPFDDKEGLHNKARLRSWIGPYSAFDLTESLYGYYVTDEEAMDAYNRFSDVEYNNAHPSPSGAKAHFLEIVANLMKLVGYKFNNLETSQDVHNFIMYMYSKVKETDDFSVEDSTEVQKLEIQLNSLKELQNYAELYSLGKDLFQYMVNMYLGIPDGYVRSWGAHFLLLQKHPLLNHVQYLFKEKSNYKEADLPVHITKRTPILPSFNVMLYANKKSTGTIDSNIIPNPDCATLARMSEQTMNDNSDARPKCTLDYVIESVKSLSSPVNCYVPAETMTRTNIIKRYTVGGRLSMRPPFAQHDLYERDFRDRLKLFRHTMFFVGDPPELVRKTILEEAAKVFEIIRTGMNVKFNKDKWVPQTCIEHLEEIMLKNAGASSSGFANIYLVSKHSRVLFPICLYFGHFLAMSADPTDMRYEQAHSFYRSNTILSYCCENEPFFSQVCPGTNPHANGTILAPNKNIGWTIGQFDDTKIKHFWNPQVRTPESHYAKFFRPYLPDNDQTVCLEFLIVLLVHDQLTTVLYKL
jgi:hypothetical protein